MPRVTRAALRSNAVLENPDPAASVPLALTPRKERTPLGEIAGNAVEDILNRKSPDEVHKLQRKGPAKTKKGRATKKANPEDNANDNIHTEVLEDDNLSATSSAVEEACEELLQDSSQGSPQVVLPDKEVDAPSSLKADAYRDNGLQDRTTHRPSTFPTSEDSKNVNENEEDSFVNSIKIRTPAKMMNTSKPPIPNPAEIKLPQTAQVLDQSSTQEQGPQEDSFVERIVTRSPAGTVTRIEDSVEAIDAFEEEIEKVGELIPTISDDAALPVKAKKSSGGGTKRAAPRSGNNGVTKRTRSKAATVTATPKARDAEKAGPKHTAQSPPLPAKKIEEVAKPESNKVPSNPAKRISSIHKAPFQPAKSTKPPTQSTFELPGDAVARKLKVQREERLRAEHEGGGKKVEVKPASKPIKSTKPLTRPTFELPGDAVARKLKEQREQRLKEQDAGAEPKGKNAFKARPIRLSQAPVVKENATSRARISLAKMDFIANKSPQDHAPTIRPAVKRPASVVPTDQKRLSTLSVAKRTPRPSTAASARVTRGPSLAPADSALLSTTAMATRRITSDGKTAHQTVRGREVFERSKSAKEEQDRLRKEKEEAAKKARAEAAERGRMASRQWAEKQKARKLSAEKGVEHSVVAAAA